jgi:hypothetical protein
MKHLEINALDVLEKRKLDFLPPHLTAISISAPSYNSRQIVEWITENLKGRYYFGPTLVLDNGSLRAQEVVAFEDPKEYTMFLLACPHLAKSKV